MLAKKHSMTLKLDGVPRYFMKKYRGSGTRYQVPTIPVLKNYRGTLVHGTAHHCLQITKTQQQKMRQLFETTA